MKKIIAIVAIIASAQASAFWGNGNNAGNGAQNGAMDAAGNATGEGEATFSMSFTGKGKTAGDFKGNGNNAVSTDTASASNAAPYYTAPQAPVAPVAK